MQKVNSLKGRRAVAVNAQPLSNQCFGYGCTDPNAYNYDPNAIYDNGSCIFVIHFFLTAKILIQEWVVGLTQVLLKLLSRFRIYTFF